MVRSVTPIISAASHHFRLPAIALKITCCTFIIRSTSAAVTCWFIPPALPTAFSKRTDHVLIRPDKSHATNSPGERRLTFACRASTLKPVKVHLPQNQEAQLNELAVKTGRGTDELVQE